MFYVSTSGGAYGVSKNSVRSLNLDEISSVSGGDYTYTTNRDIYYDFNGNGYQDGAESGIAAGQQITVRTDLGGGFAGIIDSRPYYWSYDYSTMFTPFGYAITC